MSFLRFYHSDGVSTMTFVSTFDTVRHFVALGWIEACNIRRWVEAPPHPYERKRKSTEGSIDIAPIVSLESQEGRSSKRGKVEERLSPISFIASHQGHRSTNPKSLYRSRRSSRKRVCRGYAPKMSPIAVSWDLPWWVSGPHVVVNAVEVTAPSQCPVEAPQPVVDPAPVFDPELKAQWEAAEKIEAAKRARAAEEEEEEAMNEGSGATKRQKKVERTPELVDHIPSLPSTADSTLVDLPEVEEVVFLESRKVLPGHAPYIADLAKDNSHLYASYDAELAAEIKNDREGKAILAEIAAQDLEELQAHRPKGLHSIRGQIQTRRAGRR